jgi:hypothetical protein
MEKYSLVIVVSLLVSMTGLGQRKIEQITIEWPIEYNWKVVQNTKEGSTKQMMIIPGSETPQTATIIGSMASYANRPSLTVDSMISWYQSLLDSGSKLTVIERNDTAKAPWLIFKIETPVTPKYPAPESDLYYVCQGQFALYENHVAVKRPSLDEEFLNKWMMILKTARIVIR